MSETIFVSGLYSGPSPSAGLGVARSLRAAFPSARLVGVDYWIGSSGLHHDVFDATWLKPSWDLIEEQLYAREIEAELARGAFWLPTLDLEIAWLARSVRPGPRLLAPSEAALGPTRKPRPSVAELLGLALPPSLDLSASDADAYEFCRAHSWRVWLKGPYHDAVAVRSWRDLERVRGELGKRWQTDRLSLQAHVRGYEESVCLAAVGGRLIDAVYMRKRITTPEGKTWAGRVSDLPGDLLARVESALAQIGWTGGAEIELLRDVDGGLSLLEWNPRFPGWVHGAALAGRNLPAALLRRVLGLPDAPRALGGSTEFARVVLEVPVRADLPLPLPAEPDHGEMGTSGKYGAALSAIVAKVPLAGGGASTSAPPRLSSETEADLAAARSIAATPHRLFLPRTARASFARLRQSGGGGDPGSTEGVILRHAYSLKTSPDAEYLALARETGMLAECISLLEVRRALEAGWRADEIVLNGPGKWWPESERAPDGLRGVFCDSVEELERLATSQRRDEMWGVRLRIPGFPSRFGVAVDEPAAFERLCAVVATLPAQRRFGVHVHMASTLVGIGHWRDVVESAVVWASMIEVTTGRRVQSLDLGGGYHPDDFARIPFHEVARFARASLAALDEVVVEPGRALTQHTMAVVTRVLDVRRSAGKVQELVVDTSIAELPLAMVYPHRVFRIGAERPVPVGRGAVRVLGRICMEDDVISTGLDLPDDIAVGDRLAVCDAGAYERSMSYGFGRAGYP
jgi:diaminopimelate decarboxylase